MGKREALSHQSSSIIFFSPSLCPSPLKNPLTDYQLISGSRRLRKVGSKRQNTKTLGLWSRPENRRSRDLPSYLRFVMTTAEGENS